MKKKAESTEKQMTIKICRAQREAKLFIRLLTANITGAIKTVEIRKICIINAAVILAGTIITRTRWITKTAPCTIIERKITKHDTCTTAVS